MSDRPDLIQEPWKITGAGLFMRSKGKNMTGGRRKRDCVFVGGGVGNEGLPEEQCAG